MSVATPPSRRQFFRGAGLIGAAAFAAACQAIESAQEPSRARGHAGFDAGRGWRLGGPAEYIARFEVGAAAPVVARLRADDPERLLPGALGLNRSGEVDAAAEENFEVYVLGGPTEFRVTCASVTTEFRATLALAVPLAAALGVVGRFLTQRYQESALFTGQALPPDPGQPVLVEPWSAPGTRLPGRIREIAPAAASAEYSPSE